MLEYRDIYADGRLLPAATCETVTVVSPATEEIVGSAPAVTDLDVDTAVRAARRAFDEGPWSRTSQGERAAALDRLAVALAERAPDIAWLVTAEMGMPVTASLAHNAGTPITTLRYYAALARDLEPEELRAAVNFRGQTLVRREAVGVAAIVAPWNYPITIALSQIAPALAAGCTVVFKPAPQTCLSAYVIAEAVEAADLPPGVFNLVTGGHGVAESLARHPGVDRVSFAGPPAAGRRIAMACAETLKPVNLELGGSGTAIVLDDADLDTASAGLAQLAFGNAGQSCFAAVRVLAPGRGYRDLLDCLTARAQAAVVGDPMAAATTVGPLISPRSRARVESYVGASLAAGARLLAGGRRPAAQVRGYFYQPTVLAAAVGADRADGEVFGPVVTVLPYRTEAEAVALVNCLGGRLAGSVWTTDHARGLDIATRVRTGTFGVNLYIPELGSPWGDGGGRGSALGPECLNSYLRPRSVFLPEPVFGAVHNS